MSSSPIALKSTLFNRDLLTVKNTFVDIIVENPDDEALVLRSRSRSLSWPSIYPDNQAPCRDVGVTKPIAIDTPQGKIDEVALREVLAAVSSLYEDQIEPAAILLQRRLRKRGLDWPDLQRVKGVCEAHRDLRVETNNLKGGVKFLVFLKGREGNFVDPSGQDAVFDMVPVQEFIEGTGWDEERCGVTCEFELAELLKEKVSCLSQHSLGQVRQLVRRLIKEKLVGWRKGRRKSFGKCPPRDKGKDIPSYLVPISLADKSSEGEDLAKATGGVPGADELAQRWSTFAGELSELLGSKKNKRVCLANLKKYETKFRKKLILEALGVSTLRELLEHTSVSSKCAIKPVTGSVSGFWVCAKQE